MYASTEEAARALAADCQICPANPVDPVDIAELMDRTIAIPGVRTTAT